MYGGGVRDHRSQTLIPNHTIIPVQLHCNPTAAMGGVVAADDDFPRRDERVLQWGQQETRDFIGIRAELETEFNGSKRNKSLWEVVSCKMKERGFVRSGDQCKCKWKNLVMRYKANETSDMDKCPFFEELHAVFAERADNMQRSHVEPGAGPARNRGKRNSRDHSSEELSVDVDEDESEEAGRKSNPRKRRGGREKQLSRSALEKLSPRQPSAMNASSNANSSLPSIQEMFREFILHQQRIDMEWRELMEKRAYERLLFEQEWRQSMEKLERERIMIEQTWREKEEQRRMRDENRAEKRDALLTSLLNKLLHEDRH
ncbi:trihelix transcription factor GT-3b-like [Apium graveolens]|uniref:trihelix transcription factor GT-3b-like n=1 Tax=Apium graveolens TaxID=4045 RepID=UPI003D79DAC0